MYKLITAISISFLCCQSPYVQKGTENIVLYDTEIKDSFEVRIDSYRDRTYKTPYDTIVFYFDASLKSGKYLREFYSDSAHRNTLLVGIAHFGNYRTKRRRDLMGNNDYMKHLLDSGIIPHIQKNYGWAKERMIIGHSFGGLWVYRNFFTTDSLFTTFISISPSLWVEGTTSPQEYSKQVTLDSLRTLFMYWGGGEEFNYVKGACNKAMTEIVSNGILSKKITLQELKNETHNSTLVPAIKSYYNKNE